MGAHWTLATGATVVSGLILLTAVFVRGLGGKDRFWAGVGGAIFTVYGLWGVNRTSGTFYYNWIVFVVPVAAIIFLAYRAFGSAKRPEPAPVALPLFPPPTGVVPGPPQDVAHLRTSNSGITGGLILPSSGGVPAQHIGPSTPPIFASTESASSADMTVARSRVVMPPEAPPSQNLADMTVVRSGLIAAPAPPVDTNLADMTVERSRLTEAPEAPWSDKADSGGADMTVARSRLIGAPVRPWIGAPLDAGPDMTIARPPLIAANDAPQQITRDGSTDDEKCSVCGHLRGGPAERCARCGAPLTASGRGPVQN